MATFMGRRCKGRGDDRGRAHVNARWLTKWGTEDRGKGRAGSSCTTSQVLHSGLAFGLFLGTHAGHHCECDLRISHLLELKGTWVRQQVDQGGSTWTLQELIELHDTSDGLLQHLVRTL